MQLIKESFKIFNQKEQLYDDEKQSETYPKKISELTSQIDSLKKK